jgi:hypothetical protein
MTTVSVAFQQYRLGRAAFKKGKDLHKNSGRYYRIGYNDAKRETSDERTSFVW